VYNSAKRLGQNIKKIRIAKGLTQGDLCRRLKVDRSYMSHLESGNKNPTLLTIERVASALNVTVEKLVR